ncbi:MAG: hypothetical protein L3J74_12650 [Bacteroidales bacterium]|nr:hypothetical protein [Bacteroidales bacterium]
MHDFTLSMYKELLLALKNAKYQFITFEEYFSEKLPEKLVVLRHDVDRAPGNAVKMALLENKLNIRASYYYRVVSESYDEKSIREIVNLNHELGYHYEDLSISKGNEKQALELFEKHLENFRRFYPVKTMCMHGSPMSKFDNRALWQKHNYADFQIIAEPYFDLDFNKIFYLTDASRSWNNETVTLRDKVSTDFQFQVNSTNDIIRLLQNKKLPNELMISTHPHNWADGNIEWMKIMIWQGLKNQIKKILVRKRA